MGDDIREHELYEGHLTGAELPDTLRLDTIGAEMKALWEASTEDIGHGQVREHAATLVLDVSGDLAMINEVVGGPNSVDPDRDVTPGQRMVGTFHTHPYRDGTTGIAFSGADFAYAINNGDQTTLVQSGEDVFALIRTEKTVTSVSWTAAEAEFYHLFDRHVVQDSMSDQVAVLITNLELCKKYGLAFYMGKSGEELKAVYRP